MAVYNNSRVNMGGYSNPAMSMNHATKSTMQGKPVTVVSTRQETPAAKKAEGYTTTQKALMAGAGLAVAYGVAYGVRHSQGADFNAEIVTVVTNGLATMSKSFTDLSTAVSGFFTAKNEDVKAPEGEGSTNVEGSTNGQGSTNVEGSTGTPTGTPTVEPTTSPTVAPTAGPTVEV
jgi:hypothetical protein